ncbi:hypothetical protein GBO86_02170 [Pediococcus acidilactici]|nr:hypothetical protein GBO86_02170 [Pediococcus acidilactici]UWF32976.1 helix-turn-helix domain-containing protein [Pediococcus acidilactici]
MDLWQLFLSSRQVRKVRFLEQIIAKSAVSPDDLAIRLATTNRQLKDLVEELNLEQQQFYNSSIDYYPFENRMIKLAKKVPVRTYVQFYLRLKSQYVNQSAVFKFLRFFLNTRKVGIIKLSHHFNYSQSYCYKLINKANGLLQRLNFNCRINKRLNYLLAEGDENQIRLLTYLLEITANQVVEATITPNGRPLALSHQLKTQTLLNVFDNAIKKGGLARQVPREELEVMVGVYQELHLGFRNHFSYLSKNAFSTEKMFFYLATMYYSPEILTPDLMRKVGERLGEYQNNRIITKAKRFLDTLVEKYAIPKKYYQLFLFHITLRLLVTKQLSLEVLFLATNSISDINANVRQLSRDVQRAYKNELPEKALEVFSFQIAELFYSYLSHLVVAPVKIAIYSSYSANYLMILKNILHGMYKKKAVLIVEKPADAEIIIADSAVDINDHQVLFYFEDVHHIETWKKLAVYIQTVLIKRRAQLNI